MKHVYLLLDIYGAVVAIYDDESLAATMKPALEEKMALQLTIDKRSVNQDIKMIGVVK